MSDADPAKKPKRKRVAEDGHVLLDQTGSLTITGKIFQMGIFVSDWERLKTHATRIESSAQPHADWQMFFAGLGSTSLASLAPVLLTSGLATTGEVACVFFFALTTSIGAVGYFLASRFSLHSDQEMKTRAKDMCDEMLAMEKHLLTAVPAPSDVAAHGMARPEATDRPHSTE